MFPSISSIHYYPVKSLSFSSLKKTSIKKNLGILNDRIFAFTRNIDFIRANLFENSPKYRKLHNFLTLKNSPELNKYKFSYKNNQLIMHKGLLNIISISTKNSNNYKLLVDKLISLEKNLLNPIFLIKNKNYPFFDTTHSNNISNTVSLININSIIDFEKKIKQPIELERFRSNLYIDGIDSWEERKWIDKIIKINKTYFKVQGHIARCSATNLAPNTSESTINLPAALRKLYNHIEMGIYLTPLNDGELSVGDKILIDM